jgi:hypothetical protein
MDDHAKKILLAWVIPPFVIGLVLFLILYFKGANWTNASDACFLLGAFFFAFPLLILVYRSGLFDTANYGFITFFSSFRPNSPKPYESAYAYREIKAQKRSQSKPFLLSYFAYGSLMFLLAVAFLIVFYKVQ